MRKKMKIPPEALEFFRATGSVGGKAKGTKGFAAMDEKTAKRIRAKALKTRRANAAKKKTEAAGGRAV
jgi:hypothetical protein